MRSYLNGGGQIVHPLAIQTAGGPQKENCATLEGIFRIIQSIPSKKAEPFKVWMASVAAERINQMVDPERCGESGILMVFRDYFVDFDLKLAGGVSRPTALSLLHIRSELIKRNKEFIVHLCLLRELSLEAYKNEKKTVS